MTFTNSYSTTSLCDESDIKLICDAEKPRNTCVHLEVDGAKKRKTDFFVKTMVAGAGPSGRKPKTSGQAVIE